LILKNESVYGIKKSEHEELRVFKKLSNIFYILNYEIQFFPLVNKESEARLNELRSKTNKTAPIEFVSSQEHVNLFEREERGVI
jgi:hypothetical protein